MNQFYNPICLLSSAFCRLTSHLYLYAIRISNQKLCFMQNKPNLPTARINVTSVLTKHYENKLNWTLSENKPNTNPKQSQTKPICFYAQMNVSSVLTKHYENKRPCRRGENKPKTNPIKANFKRDTLLLCTALVFLLLKLVSKSEPCVGKLRAGFLFAVR